MTIRAKILAGCSVLIALTWLLGAYGQKTQRELGTLALHIYDDAFMGVSYLRSAQIGFAGLKPATQNGTIDPDDISEIVDDLAVARDRAMSPQGRAAAEALSGSVAALAQPGADVSTAKLDAVRTEFESAVETFAGDGFRYRRDVGQLISSQARQISSVLAASVIGALAVSLLLTRLIAPPVRRAVGVAQAIAAGKLDNVIVTNGRGETADLLRALAIMQDSIAEALAQIHALMEEQAVNHAGELAEHHARLEAALNNMTQGLCLFSDTGRLVVANQRFADMFGHPQADAPCELVLHDAGLSMLAGSLDGSNVAALSCELPDGRSIAVSQQPVQHGGWVVTFEDVSERRRTEEQMAYLSRHDALTGLANRLLFSEHLQAGLARSRRNGERIAVLHMDLDRFKAVNDTLGHAAGDTLLVAVAERLRSCIREIDLAARLGADEFVVIQATANLLNDTAALARRLVETLTQPFTIMGQELWVGVSIGIAMSAEDGDSVSDMLHRADLALYRAKHEGRGTFRFFEPEMDEAILRKRELERDLRSALAENRLQVFYQPLVQVAGVAGFEALLRWRHPERGLVSPALFVPIAEECGMIGAIGAWVLEQACIDAASWPGELKVAVNLSPAQFQTRSLVEDVEHALSVSGLSPKRLELEITESILIQDGEPVLATLHTLRRRGIRIAMDDFGTGYSSLSYLRRFPFDKIKIDQSFVRGIADHEECLTIVRAVIGLGRSLRIAVNAEGVETEAQLLALRSEGCGEIQGFYFSKPIPGDRVANVLAAWGNATLPAQ